MVHKRHPIRANVTIFKLLYNLGYGAASHCLTRISQNINFEFKNREFALLRLCNANGAPIGQIKFPLNYHIISGTKVFAKLFSKSGEKAALQKQCGL